MQQYFLLSKIALLVKIHDRIHSRLSLPIRWFMLLSRLNLGFQETLIRECAMCHCVIAVFKVTGKSQRHLHNVFAKEISQTALIQTPGL
jgi:hypothetical protein